VNSKRLLGTSEAKAAIYVITDAEERKAWGANRIRDPVVHAVTDGCSMSDYFGFGV
jgi:hypothetical protein